MVMVRVLLILVVLAAVRGGLVLLVVLVRGRVVYPSLQHLRPGRVRRRGHWSRQTDRQTFTAHSSPAARSARSAPPTAHRPGRTFTGPAVLCDDESDHDSEGAQQQEEDDRGADVAAQARLLVDVDLLIGRVGAASIVAGYNDGRLLLQVHEGGRRGFI